MTKTEAQKMKKMEALLKYNNIKVPADKKTYTIKKEVEVNITKEEFELYLDVQSSGLYNMFDPRERETTNLIKEQWIRIMKEYDKLDKAWSEDNES